MGTATPVCAEACSSTSNPACFSAASASLPCGSASTSAVCSGWGVRCRESDSPGNSPLPSHAIGDSISVEGFEVGAGRDGAAAWAADFEVSSAAAPPYFRSDSPGSTNAAGVRSDRGAAGAGVRASRALVSATASCGPVSVWPSVSLSGACEPEPPRPPRRRRRPRHRFAPCSSVSCSSCFSSTLGWAGGVAK